MFDIEEELKKLPAQPGVYIMHDEKDAIIYVGKAISLKNRVRQYFQANRNRGVKIDRMVTHITRFEYIVTDSELEALILECNLIKEHRPKYNTMLMDDKAYPFIKVTLGEEFPRVIFSHQMQKDKSKYFGPYTSYGAVKNTLELIRKIYRLRTCNRVLPRDCGKERPCLNYHIHQCDAPCQGNISSEEYQKRVDAAMDLLNGNYVKVIEMLKEKMYQHSENLEFEKAGEYKELMNSVRTIAEKQKITNTGNEEDKDIIAMARERDDAVVQVFFIRGGKLIGRDHFFLQIDRDDEDQLIISDFIKQFYSGTPFIPKEIMLQYNIEDEEILESWLTLRRGSKVKFLVPQKGQKEKMVELAAENARMVLSKDKERIKKEEGRTIGAIKELVSLLGIQEANRIEAFDISNISGYDSVGSMIVYEKGKPLKNDYRKFKIKYVKGPNDYASMEEVLTRRFRHGIEEQEKSEKSGLEGFDSFTKFPSLIMMDGGRGQVNIALKVLGEFGLDIPVCGMVKDDNHNTRGLYYNNIEIPIDKDSECFKLITRIQDEAHRFAIEFHRSLRSKGQVHSILDDIENIGPARRKALLRSFTSVEKIREASLEEIKAVDSMNEAAAESVYNFFHTK